MIKTIIYIFLKSANKSIGIIVDKMIIIPPIVGVPFLALSPGRSNFLMFSSICLDFKKFIIFLPNIVEMTKANMNVIADLNDKYWNKLAPAN
jgi:hypothetical protein